MKNKSIYIEFLDNGFIVKVDGVKKAIETEEKLQELLFEQVKELTSKMKKVGDTTHDMLIDIEVRTNLPQESQSKIPSSLNPKDNG